MRLDRTFLLWAMSYAVVGMGLGIFMAASQNHRQADTHSHILLVGFVGSLAYAVIHKLWLGGERASALAKAQLILHQAGAVTLAGALLLLYAEAAPQATLNPVLAVASLAVLLAAILMLVMVLRTRTAAA